MKKMMFYVLMLMGAVLQTPILVSMHPRELGALTQALPIEKQVRADFENWIEGIFVSILHSVNSNKKINKDEEWNNFCKRIYAKLLPQIEADNVDYIKAFIENLASFKQKIFLDQMIQKHFPHQDNLWEDGAFTVDVSGKDVNGCSYKTDTILAKAFFYGKEKIIQFCIDRIMREKIKVTDNEISVSLYFLDAPIYLISTRYQLCSRLFQVAYLTDKQFSQRLCLIKSLFLDLIKKQGLSDHPFNTYLAQLFMPYISLKARDMGTIYPELSDKKGNFDLLKVGSLTDEQRTTPLLNAYLLQEKKYDLVRFEPTILSPLHFAAKYGLFKLIDDLCNEKNVYAYEINQLSPMALALYKNHYMVIEALLSKFPDLATKACCKTFDGKDCFPLDLVQTLLKKHSENFILEEINVLLLSYLSDDDLDSRPLSPDLIVRIKAKKAARTPTSRIKKTPPPATASSELSQEQLRREQALAAAFAQLNLDENVMRSDISQVYCQIQATCMLSGIGIEEQALLRLEVSQEELAKRSGLLEAHEGIKRAEIIDLHNKFYDAVVRQKMDRRSVESTENSKRLLLDVEETEERLLCLSELEKDKTLHEVLAVKRNLFTDSCAVVVKAQAVKLQVQQKAFVTSETTSRNDLNQKAKSSFNNIKQMARREAIIKQSDALKKEFSYLQCEEPVDGFVKDAMTVYAEPSPTNREDGEVEVCLTPRKINKIKFKTAPEESPVNLELSPYNRAYLESMTLIDQSLESVPVILDETEVCIRPICVSQLFSLHPRVEAYLAFNVRQDIEEKRQDNEQAMPEVTQMDHAYTLSWLKNIVLNGATFFCSPSGQPETKRIAFVAKASMSDVRGKRDGYATLVFALDGTCIHYCFTREHPGDVKFRGSDGVFRPAYVLEPVRVKGNIDNGQLKFMVLE